MAFYPADGKTITELMRNRESAQAASKLDRVSNETAAILSLLRRYQALMAHWHAAFPGRILDVPYDALVTRKDPMQFARRWQFYDQAGDGLLA